MDDLLVHTVSLLQYKRYALKAKDEPTVNCIVATALDLQV